MPINGDATQHFGPISSVETTRDEPIPESPLHKPKTKNRCSLPSLHFKVSLINSSFVPFSKRTRQDEQRRDVESHIGLLRAIAQAPADEISCPTPSDFSLANPEELSSVTRPQKTTSMPRVRAPIDEDVLKSGRVTLSEHEVASAGPGSSSSLEKEKEISHVQSATKATETSRKFRPKIGLSLPRRSTKSFVKCKQEGDPVVSPRTSDPSAHSPQLDALASQKSSQSVIAPTAPLPRPRKLVLSSMSPNVKGADHLHAAIEDKEDVHPTSTKLDHTREQCCYPQRPCRPNPYQPEFTSLRTFKRISRKKSTVRVSMKKEKPLPSIPASHSGASLPPVRSEAKKTETASATMAMPGSRPVRPGYFRNGEGTAPSSEPLCPNIDRRNHHPEKIISDITRKTTMIDLPPASSGTHERVEIEVGLGPTRPVLQISPPKSSMIAPNSTRGARLGLQIYRQRHGVEPDNVRSAQETMEQGSYCSKMKTHEHPAEVVENESLSPSVSATSLFSDAATDETSLTTPSPSLRRASEEPTSPSKLDKGITEEADVAIPADAAEEIILRILSKLDNLRDLLSAAVISKGFYVTYKRHQESLVKTVLFKMSPAAWEFQAITAPSTKPFPCYQQTHKQSVESLTALRSLIIVKCDVLLSPEMLAGLVGADENKSAQIDNALWRIWTFCQRFGRNTGCVDDIKAQCDWLDGGKSRRARSQDRSQASFFGIGNGCGLSRRELCDMAELWTCLSTLLEHLRCDVVGARRAGVFKTCPIDALHDEDHYLQEWIFYIMTLGPAVVLELSAVDFDQAAHLEFVSWKPLCADSSRSQFLRQAIRVVYKNRLLAEAEIRATGATVPRRASKRVRRSANIDETVARHECPSSRESCSSPPPGSSAVDDRLWKTRRQTLPATPLTDKSDSMTALHGITVPAPLRPIHTTPAQVHSQHKPTSPISPTTPTLVQSLALHPNASTKVGSSLFPAEDSSASSSPTTSPYSPTRAYDHFARLRGSRVIDPVDRAMATLVDEMGFSVADAKRGLAQSEDGFGVNVEFAVNVLLRETFPDRTAPRSRVRRRISGVDGTPGLPPQGKESSAAPARQPRSAEKSADHKRLDGVMSRGRHDKTWVISGPVASLGRVDYR